MSTSGIIERTKTNGMLKFTSKSLDEDLLSRYANAMCPTANEAFSSLKAKHSAVALLSL
jgi:hypothetical protein